MHIFLRFKCVIQHDMPWVYVWLLYYFPFGIDENPESLCFLILEHIGTYKTTLCLYILGNRSNIYIYIYIYEYRIKRKCIRKLYLWFGCSQINFDWWRWSLKSPKVLYTQDLRLDDSNYDLSTLKCGLWKEGILCSLFFLSLEVEDNCLWKKMMEALTSKGVFLRFPY